MEGVHRSPAERPSRLPEPRGRHVHRQRPPQENPPGLLAASPRRALRAPQDRVHGPPPPPPIIHLCACP